MDQQYSSQNPLQVLHIANPRYTVMFDYRAEDIQAEVAVEITYNKSAKEIKFTIWLPEELDSRRIKIGEGRSFCESENPHDHIQEVSQYMHSEDARNAMLHILTCDGCSDEDWENDENTDFPEHQSISYKMLGCMPATYTGSPYDCWASLLISYMMCSASAKIAEDAYNGELDAIFLVDDFFNEVLPANIPVSLEQKKEILEKCINALNMNADNLYTYFCQFEETDKKELAAQIHVAFHSNNR